MSAMFDANFNILSVKVLKQHWTQQKFSYMKKARPDYGIMLLLNGEIDFVSSDERLCANRGDVIFLPQDSHYEAIFKDNIGDIDNYLINFNTDIEFTDIRKPKLLAENVSFGCLDMFRQFVENNYNIETVDLRSKGMFYLLLNCILNENNEIKTKSEIVIARAKALLSEDDGYSIEKIAKDCAVSESGLRKIFKDNLGVSPIQYRITEKITKAKYLLEATDMTVDEISDKLGFFDTAYFCKTFSKYVGTSPGKYSRNKKL